MQAHKANANSWRLSLAGNIFEPLILGVVHTLINQIQLTDGSNAPPTLVFLQETPEAFKVTVAVPGYTSKSKVTATMDSNILIISGRQDVLADCVARKLAGVSITSKKDSSFESPSLVSAGLNSSQHAFLRKVQVFSES